MTKQQPSSLPIMVSETLARQGLANTLHHAQAACKITLQESAQTPEEIEAYWTPERMAQAQPVPPPSSRHQGRRADEYRAQPATGEPGALLEYKTSEVPRQQIDLPPFQSIGKLFFTLKGIDYVGSASVVAENGLITAAHNLYDRETDTWCQKIKFCPAFVEGHANARYGSWSEQDSSVDTRWITADDYDAVAYDVGFVKLHLGGIGPTKRAIGTVVGQLPILVDVKDLDEEVRWNALGYPATPIEGYDFNGKNMWVCDGHYKALEDGVVEMWGNLTHGASGGPWLIKRDGRYVINGINSRFTQADSTIYSSYFGAWVAANYLKFFGL